jgi:hypothetical protein
MIEQFGLELLHLRCRGLDSRRIGRWLIEQGVKLSPGGDQALKIPPRGHALRVNQGADVGHLLICQAQAFLGPMPEDLRHRRPIFGGEKRLSAVWPIRGARQRLGQRRAGQCQAQEEGSCHYS